MSKSGMEYIKVRKDVLRKIYSDYQNQKSISKHTIHLNIGLLRLYQSADLLRQRFHEVFELCQIQNETISSLIGKLIQCRSIKENDFTSGINWDQSDSQDFKIMKKKALRAKDLLLSISEFGDLARERELEQERNKLKSLVDSLDAKFKLQGDRLMSMQKDYIMVKSQLEEKKNILEANNRKLMELDNSSLNKYPNEPRMAKAPKEKMYKQEVKVSGGAVHELLAANMLREEPEGTDKVISCAFCGCSHPLFDYKKHNEVCPKRKKSNVNI